ncbi:MULTISPECIES: TauD/TfdA family dioxygenase [Nostocales]|uniref:TauD/TfdA family dioxygenase n=3 Tax=Nostocales TaxID=1161 RepID=A0A0C1MXX2_9CYAN|nr:TauD/TfdA family dioxygenase [Tolypothrix bouteillei]KAF3889390.1 TauD/TfdA family dioxygenase [Tolypothrix bouteillei VB521301]
MAMSSFETATDSNITGDIAIANHHYLLKEQGYVYLEEIPDGFDYLGFVQNFGTLIPHKYNGEYVFSIKVEPNLGERYPAFTTSDVEPHTEGYEYEQIPLHYQCLWCVNPPSCGGGHTLLADGYSFVHSLTNEEREYITNNHFDFVTPSNNIVKHPLYDVESCEQPIIRFNFSSIKRDNAPHLNNITNRFLQFFDNEKISIKWSKNALLIWDNFRMLHSRTQYQDRERHLKRVYIK